MSVLEAVDGVCRSVVGSGVSERLFRSTAVGDVFGVRLDDGSSYTRALRRHGSGYLRV
jgi:hypothetical protein